MISAILALLVLCNFPEYVFTASHKPRLSEIAALMESQMESQLTDLKEKANVCNGALEQSIAALEQRQVALVESQAALVEINGLLVESKAALVESELLVQQYCSAIAISVLCCMWACAWMRSPRNRDNQILQQRIKKSLKMGSKSLLLSPDDLALAEGPGMLARNCFCAAIQFMEDSDKQHLFDVSSKDNVADIVFNSTLWTTPTTNIGKWPSKIVPQNFSIRAILSDYQGQNKTRYPCLLELQNREQDDVIYVATVKGYLFDCRDCRTESQRNIWEYKIPADHESKTIQQLIEAEYLDVYEIKVSWQMYPKLAADMGVRNR